MGTVRSLRLILIVSAVTVCIAAAQAQEEPKLELLGAESFEAAEIGALPEGWSVDFGNEEDVAVSDAESYEGERSLHLVDASEEDSTGLRSPKMPVEPGNSYWMRAWWLGADRNNASVYVEYWDAAGVRMQEHVRSHGVTGTGRWSRCMASSVAPQGAVAATVLLYSSSTVTTDGYFDAVEFGMGVPVLFDRTPRPPAEVDHPVGLYTDSDIEQAQQNIERHEWAQREFEAIKSRSEWWMNLADEEIATWIPVGTPFRVCDCPNCGAAWGVGPWTFHSDGRTECKRCGTIYPNEEFPETGVEEYVNPLGQREQITSYVDADGKHYRLEGLRKYGRINKLGSLGWLGRAYALTGDVAYAEKVRKVLLRLAEVYPAYIAHDWYNIYPDYSNLQSGKMSGWKLHDATTFIELCLAYDLTVESGVYSDEDRSLIEEGAFREAGRLLTSTSPRGCCVNDGPFLMAAGGYIGKLLGEHDYVAWALEPPGGFFGFIEENFWRDGHWEDGSPSYELMALAEFSVLPEIMHGYSDPPAYQGRDRYENLDMLANPLMSKLLIAGMYVTAPDGHQPANNDSTFGANYPARHAETNHFWFPTERNLRLMAHAYKGNAADTGSEYSLFRRDPELSFDEVEPLNLATESLVRPGLGWAILRAGEGAEQVMTLLDFGPVRGHAHADKLNFAFWAHGRELVTDLGYLGARHHFQPWLRAPAAHNEVLVDGDAPKLGPGELQSFAPGEFAQSIRAAAPAVYDQVERYERALTMVAPPGGPAYLVDVFDVSGGERHLMAFHGDGEGFSSPLEFAPDDTEFITTKAESGDWIRSQERATPDGSFTADWRIAPEDPLGVRLTVLDDAEAAWHITAPGLRDRSNTWGDATFHGLLWEQPGPTSRFVSVIEAVQGSPRLRGIERIATSSPTATGVRVERDGATDYVFVSDTTEPVTATEPAGLQFAGRQAIVSIRDGQPVFARLVEGTSLTLGDLKLSCAGPMQGAISAFDDEADTFTTEALLPEGEALRGQQLIVAGRVDGAYVVDRVERTAAGSLVHLADEPIIRVEAGDAFSVPSVVEVSRIEDGTWSVRADCDVETELPRPATFNSRVMLRSGAGWTELPHERTNGAVSFRIPASGLHGGAAVLLLTNGDVDLSDSTPPTVERVLIDGAPCAAALQPGVADLGFVSEPRTIAVELRDDANTLFGDPVVSLLGADARYTVSIIPGRNDPRRATALIRLRDLPEGQYELRLTAFDRAANEAKLALRFNTRGLVFMAQGLPIVGSSGKVSKPLEELGTQFYRAEAPGDFVEYELDVPSEGRYELTLIASGNPSYAIMQPSLDGQPLGEPVDCYLRALDATGIVAPLGMHDLAAGPHRLRLEVIGKNDLGSDYFVGWHSIALRPAGD